MNNLKQSVEERKLGREPYKESHMAGFEEAQPKQMEGV